MAKRSPSVADAVYSAVREAGPDGAEREQLVAVAQVAGASLEQARKTVTNLLTNGRLQRRIVEGHTTIVMAGAAPVRAPAAAEPVPPAGGGYAPKVKRRSLPPATVAETKPAAGDSPFRCGVLDTGELLIVQGDRHATFTAQESLRLWRVLQKHHGEVTT